MRQHFNTCHNQMEEIFIFTLEKAKSNFKVCLGRICGLQLLGQLEDMHKLS